MTSSSHHHYDGPRHVLQTKRHTRITCCLTARLHASARRLLINPFSLILFRPPDIVCRRTYVLPIILLLSSFFFSPTNLRARWTELNDHWPHGRKSVQFKNACPKSGVSFPYKLGVQKPPFWTTSQLNGNFNGLYLRIGTWYRQSVKRAQNYEVVATSS